MGLRFRKSINFGAGFRVNFSKSGVGYSWGGKGFRVTKTATGRTRTTTSIPGTGLSWVEESGSKKRSGNTNQTIPQSQSDSTHLYSVENADVGVLTPAQLQDFLDSIQQYRTVNKLFSLGIVIFFVLWLVVPSQASNSVGAIALFLLFFLSILAKIIYSFVGKIKVQYEYDEYGAEQMALIAKLIDILKSNSALWQVNDVFSNAQKRTNAGAATSIERFPLKIQTKTPPFLKTNIQCYSVKLKNEMLYILPDKILVVKKGKIGALNLSDLNVIVDSTNFIEDIAPKDATVIRYTWQYVNNNGTPDKRFKNNKELPVCRYGTISFKTDDGFNTLIYCSNTNKAIEFLKELGRHA